MTECEIDPTTQPKCDELFREIEAQFEASQIPSDKWYLTALSALTTTPDPHLADQLYVYLTSTPAYSTVNARQILIQRIRETLFKNIALLGLPKPTEALISISRVEPMDDIDQSFTREGWQCDNENRVRGMEWLNKIFAHNTKDLFDLFSRHRDWQFWVGEIAYGWHIRGTRRLGISKEDVDGL